MSWALGAKGAMVHAANTDVTPLPVPYPTGITAGQILDLYWSCATASGAVATPPSGWALDAERNGSGGTPRIFSKIADGTETGTAAVTCGTNAWCAGQIARWTGGPGTLTGIAHTSASAGGSTGLNIARAPALTISQANTRVIRLGAKNNGANTISALSGFTKGDEGAGGGQHMMFWEYQIQTTATNVSSGTWTVGAGDSSVSSCGLAVSLIAGTTSPPTITSVDSDDIVTSTQANVVIAGTNLTSSGTVELVDGTVRQTLSQDSWSSTSIQVDMSLGGCRYGTLTIVVTASNGLTASKAITVNPPSGTSAVDLVTLRANVLNARNTPTRLYSSPDVPDSSQIEITRSAGSGTVTVDDDGRLQWADTATQIQWRWNAGSGWSSLYTWDLRGLAPLYVGPAPPSLTFSKDSAITSINHSTRFINEEGGTLTYSLQGGSLPTGLALSSSTAVESGTPTVAQISAGLVIRATDTGGLYAETPAFSRTIEATPNPPQFLGTIPDVTAVVGQTFSLDLSGYFLFCTSFSLSAGLPAGLSFNTSTAVISGTAAVLMTSALAVTGFGTGTPATSNSFDFETILQTVVMPDVVDTANASAVAVLEALGLAASITMVPSTSVTVGNVISQSVEANTDVAIGTTIFLVISLGDAVRFRNQVTSGRAIRPFGAVR